jgi:hypothetical protein
MLKINRRFGGICDLHLQGRRINQTRNQRERKCHAETLHNIRACHLLSSWFLVCLILRPWRWRRHVPPKLLLISTDHRCENLTTNRTKEKKEDEFHLGFMAFSWLSCPFVLHKSLIKIDYSDWWVSCFLSVTPYKCRNIHVLTSCEADFLPLTIKDGQMWDWAFMLGFEGCGGRIFFCKDNSQSCFFPQFPVRLSPTCWGGRQVRAMWPILETLGGCCTCLAPLDCPCSA